MDLKTGKAGAPVVGWAYSKACGRTAQWWTCYALEGIHDLLGSSGGNQELYLDSDTGRIARWEQLTTNSG